LNTYESYSIPFDDDVGEQRRAARRSAGMWLISLQRGNRRKQAQRLGGDQIAAEVAQARIRDRKNGNG
jgi:hypothetical protein